MMKQPADPEKLATHTASFHRWAGVLAAALAQADHLATERFTCAEIAVAAALTCAAPDLAAEREDRLLPPKTGQLTLL